MEGPIKDPSDTSLYYDTEGFKESHLKASLKPLGIICREAIAFQTADLFFSQSVPGVLLNIAAKLFGELKPETAFNNLGWK